MKDEQVDQTEVVKKNNFGRIPVKDDFDPTTPKWGKIGGKVGRKYGYNRMDEKSSVLGNINIRAKCE
jgi:hypothetical protein